MLGLPVRLAAPGTRTMNAHHETRSKRPHTHTPSAAQSSLSSAQSSLSHQFQFAPLAESHEFQKWGQLHTHRRSTVSNARHCVSRSHVLVSVNTKSVNGVRSSSIAWNNSSKSIVPELLQAHGRAEHRQHAPETWHNVRVLKIDTPKRCIQPQNVLWLHCEHRTGTGIARGGAGARKYEQRTDKRLSDCPGHGIQLAPRHLGIPSVAT